MCAGTEEGELPWGPLAQPPVPQEHPEETALRDIFIYEIWSRRSAVLELLYSNVFISFFYYFFKHLMQA